MCLFLYYFSFYVSSFFTKLSLKISKSRDCSRKPNVLDNRKNNLKFLNFEARQHVNINVCVSSSVNLKCCIHGTSQVVLVVKNPPANTGDIRDMGSIPGLGRSLGGGHANTLQYSCLENQIARGAWWAKVHWVTKSRTWLKQLSRHGSAPRTKPPISATFCS